MPDEVAANWCCDASRLRSEAVKEMLRCGAPVLDYRCVVPEAGAKQIVKQVSVPFLISS